MIKYLNGLNGIPSGKYFFQWKYVNFEIWLNVHFQNMIRVNMSLHLHKSLREEW